MIEIKICFVLLFLSCLSFSADCLKVLAIFPYIGKSHHYVIDPILTILSERGHDVTVVSRFPPKDNIPNRRDIVFSQDEQGSGDIIDLRTIDMIPEALKFSKIVGEMAYFTMNAKDSCIRLLSNKDVQDILKSGTKYDVILLEQFNTDCSLGIVYKLGAPSIGLTSDTLMPWHFERYGAITNPSYVPCHALGYGTKPNILETATSWCVCAAIRMAYYLTITLPTQSITRQYLGDDVPSFDILARNISMVMTNSYFPLHGAYPIAPNMLEVGGLHLKNTNPLPDDLQKLLDETKHGVIYFSFGSMAKMNTMPLTKLKDLQDAFAELPETILWKWENDTMPDQPKNVVIRKWLPQFDILNHKNVKAFITHSGMLSTTEAVYAGVPVVAIPLFGDQFLNAQAAKESGLGTILHFHDITKENVLNALKTVLDPKFRQNAKRISSIWKDRPMTPIDTAIFWIEHIAKYGGAHLRPSSADLPLYRYLLLDIIGFLLLVSSIIFYISYKCCAFMYRTCCRSSKTKTD